MSTQKHIVIGGGGFAGIKSARELARKGFRVTLISRQSTFAYYPQLYHAATGGVRSESAIPLAEIIGSLPIEVMEDTLTELDAVKRTVTGESGKSYPYDELILALGNVTNYFGIEGLKEFSFGIKSIEEAIEFKQHLHRQLVEERRLDLHYIVIGAGPTGVELAGALPGYLARIVRHHGLNPAKLNIELVEAAPRILGRLPEPLARHTAKRLDRLGVQTATGMQVLAETADALKVKGESIKTHTVIWTAGVTNNPFYKANASAFELDKGGRAVVDEHLQAAPHVYVLGDNAATKYTGLAQTAIGDAKFVVRNLVQARAGRALYPYRPVRPVSVIPVGQSWAAVAYGWLRCYGRLGWTIRRLADLVGYSDIESRGPALRHWLADKQGEEDCPMCEESKGDKE